MRRPKKKIGSPSLSTLEAASSSWPQLSVQGAAMVAVVSEAMTAETALMYRTYKDLDLTTSAGYVKNPLHITPSINARTQFMEKTMPISTAIQRSQLQSKNSSDVERAHRNRIREDSQLVAYVEGKEGIGPSAGKEKQYEETKKKNEKYLEHDMERRRKALLLTELTMGMASQKHSVSPTSISVGVRLVWGGTSRYVHNTLCTDGMACAREVAVNVIGAIVNAYESKDTENIKAAMASGGRKMIVSWIDNKAFLNWLKEKGIREDFTKIVYTITELHKVVEKLDPPTSDVRAFPSMDVSLFADLMRTGVVVPSVLRYITAVDSPPYQGLRAVDAGRSMMAKSSSYNDVRDYVVKGRLGKGLGMDKAEVMGVMDGEFLLHLLKLTLHDPDATKNLFVSQALWHVKAHAVKNMFMDRTYQLLLIIPFMVDCMDMQAKKKLEQRDEWLAKMRPFSDQAVPPAAPKATSKRKPVDDEPSSQFAMLLRNHASPDETALLILQHIGQDTPDKDDETVDAGTENEGIRLAEDELPKAMRKNLHSAAFLHDMVRVVHAFSAHPDGRAKGTLYSYHQFRNEGSMNYARQEYLTELLTLAGMQVMSEMEAIAETNNSWPVRMVVDLVQNGFEGLCMEPTRSIVLHGSAQLFIETLHHYIALMAHYQRFKVCKGMFLSLMSAHRMTTDRLDLGKFYFQNATLGNDLITELGNAAANSMLSGNNASPTPEEAEQLLMEFQAKREFLQQVNESHGKPPLSSSSKGRGEVVRQQMRVFEATCAKRDLEVVKAWLIHHCRQLAATNLQGDLEGVDSVDGMISNGLHQMEEKVIPELEAYMRKERRIAAIEKAATSGDTTAIYKCYLHMFNNSSLQLALLAKSFTFSYTKETLVDKVAAAYTKEQFNSYFVDNKLCNEDRITQKMEELKQLRANDRKK